MTITYAIWQGSTLLSINNIATSIKDVDKVIAELNDSDVAKKVKFSANIQKIEVGKWLTLSTLTYATCAVSMATLLLVTMRHT
jgi:hypothetical protein